VIPIKEEKDKDQKFTDIIQDKEQYDNYMMQIEQDFEKKM